MPSERQLLLSPLAMIDIEEIFAYTHTTWGLEQALSYQEAIFHNMSSLLEHPQLGIEVGLEGKAYRMLVVGSHHIYYRWSSVSVIIIRILHGRSERKP